MEPFFYVVSKCCDEATLCNLQCTPMLYRALKMEGRARLASSHVGGHVMVNCDHACKFKGE